MPNITIEKSLYDEIAGFCELNSITDVNGFINKTLNKGFDMEKYGSEGAPLHDPCVIAYLLDPHLFKGRYINVMIEVQSELTLGMTVADWWRVTDRKPNALFIGDLHADGFYALLTDRLARL